MFHDNNAENVIDILTNYELLEAYFTTLQSSDSFFSYENVGSIKLNISTIKKDATNDMQDCTHTASNV